MKKFIVKLLQKMSFFDNFRKHFKKQNINQETDEKKFSKLSSLFIKDPKKAIEHAKKYFLKSKKKVTYEQFIDEVKSTQKTSYCSHSWTKRSLCGTCFDCQKFDSSCFCIPCFLAGHHDQHNSVLFYCDSGNCDCGNPSFINPSGFCPHHPGPDPNPDISQMTPENRTKFITVFKSAYYAAMNFKSKENMIACLKYISEFTKYGDGICRCAAYAIVSLTKEHLYNQLTKFDQDMYQALIDLYGQLISDFYFLEKMSFLYFKKYEIVANTLGQFLIEHNYNDVFLSVRLFDSFSYHYFALCPVEHAISKTNFNWPDFLINMIDIAFNTIIKSDYEYDQNYDANTIHRIISIECFLNAVLTFDDQHEKIQEFIDKYSSLLVKYEGLIPFCVKLVPEDDNDKGYVSQVLMTILGKLNAVFSRCNEFSSKKNKQFSITHVVSCLNQFCTKKAIKNESILNSLKNTEISTNIHLHTLFFCLIQCYDDVKSLVENECKKNSIDFQKFCSDVSICPLRIVAAFFVSGKFDKLNNGNIKNFDELLESPLVTFNFYFGLVQTLLGIAPNKEQIIENALTTFGCFENVSEFQNKLDKIDYDRQFFLLQNVDFDAGIFIMSLLTDHSIISLNKVYFNRLRVIELLKKNKATSADIQEYISEGMIGKDLANELIEYIKRVPNKKGGSYFTLINEGDFTPFFPLIHMNDRTNLLMKCKDKLIPVSDYVDFPRQICLKSCFRLPSFIALTFDLLSSNNLAQVGISMFISLVRNGEKYPPESFNKPNPISITAKNLNELISELSKVEDRLNQVNILTINIAYADKEPTTLINLVQSSKQLANLAIEKAELPISVQPSTEDKVSQKIKEKKAKAALFKQRLLKEYQNKQKQFDATDQKNASSNKSENTDTKKVDDDDKKDDSDDSDDDDNDDDVVEDFTNSEIICNVCLSNQEDIFGFPCISFPTTLPSIIDYKLHDNKVPYSSYEKTYTMNICSHHIHYKCYKDLLKDSATKMSIGDIMSAKTQLYQCPIDRGSRNCFLPMFVSSSSENPFKMSVSNNLKGIIDDFMIHAFYHTSQSDIDVPMKSFAGIILLLEVRQRSRPDAFDHPGISALLSNLFLTLYHGIRGLNLKKISTKMKDPLTKLVCMLINSDNPIDEFTSFVQICASDLRSDFLYEFLRRCAIIEEFAIKDSSLRNKFVDWDDVLKFDNLLLRFHVATEDDTNIELPVFQTIQLPEKFISLCTPPYNFGLFESSSLLRVVDLITGQVCVIPENSQSKVKDSIVEYNTDVYKGGLSMFLVLTGEKASSVLFYSSVIKKEWFVDSFYTDQFGDVDAGFKRGVVTLLSKERLQGALDNLLSSDIALFSLND